MAIGDIVLSVTADVGPLQSGMAKGVSALAAMEKSGKALAAQLDKIGEAGVKFQQQVRDFAGISDGIAKSARSSAQAFEAFDNARASVDRLRASYDPLFAASQRYEAALRELDAALEMGVLSGTQHAQMVDRLGEAYLRSGTELDRAKSGLFGLGNISRETRWKIQQAGFQVQDFAVQVGAGTSATQAFAQQFPQLAGAFGPVGVAIGTLAAIGIPLLVAAFGSASEEADKLTAAAERQKATIDSLREATARLRLERQMETSGAQLQEEQEALNRIAELTKQREEAQKRLNQLVSSGGRAAVFGEEAKAKRDALQAEIDSYNVELAALQNERDIATATRARANEMRQALIERKNAQDALEASLARAYGLYAKTRGEAVALADATFKAAQAFSNLQYGMELANTGQSSGPDAARTKVQFGGGAFAATVTGAGLPSAVSGAAGGGGGSNPLIGDLESLQKQLATQAELEQQAFDASQATLQTALDQRLITMTDYQSNMERLQQQHQERMAQIDVARYGDGQQQLAGYLGVIADTFQSGNEKMQKVARIAGAAEALINAWRAFSQTLADPKLPFFAKFAAGASVLAAGMQAVNAIKSGSSSTSIARPATPTATSAAAAPLEVRLTGFGPGDMFTGSMIGSLLDKLSTEAGDRGYKIMVAA